MTITAYMTADIIPQNIPNRLPPFLKALPLISRIPSTTAAKPIIFINESFSRKRIGDAIMTITGPQ